jgi:hypothetical protein
MDVNWYGVIEVSRAVAWPAFAAFALHQLRAPLGGFLEAIGHRATKIGAFNVSVELAQSVLRPVALPQLDPLKKDGLQVQEPGSLSFFNFASDKRVPDVIINLGAGNEWLTSRLFLIAALLPRFAGLKCIVFCNGASGRHFLGLAQLDAVRATLARRYPHFESALVSAQTMTMPNLAGVQEVNEIARNFLLQLRAAGPMTDAVEVDGQYWERAAWLKPELLSDVLDEHLVTDAVRYRAAAPQESMKDLLREETPFAALVTGNRQFFAVVDRYELLQAFALEQLSA